MYALWFIFIGSVIIVTVSVILYQKNELEDWAVWLIAPIAIFGVASVATLIVSIALPIKAKQETAEFIINKEQVEQVVSSGDSWENAMVTNTVIEMNKWLAQAKASKRSFGWFSMYVYEDVESLEPIVIPKKPSDG